MFKQQKLWPSIIGAVLLLLALSGCDSSGGGAYGGSGSAPATATPAAATVQDRASLMAALQQGGAKVSSEGAIQQPFLSVSGQSLNVNGQSVQTFEYATAAAMAVDAGKIGPDGSIPTMMISWIAQPHFYKAGRLLVIYPGTDAPTLAALKAALGDPFATGATVVGTPMIRP